MPSTREPTRAAASRWVCRLPIAAPTRARLYDYGVEVELPYTFAADEGVEDNRFTIGFDTTTTGIDAIKPGAQTDGAIYTLDGIRVSTTAPKGIYIQNHKKIVK